MTSSPSALKLGQLVKVNPGPRMLTREEVDLLRRSASEMLGHLQTLTDPNSLLGLPLEAVHDQTEGSGPQTEERG